MKYDHLHSWCTSQKLLFVAPTDGQLLFVREVLARFPELARPESELPNADPYLIAMCLERKRGAVGELPFKSGETWIVTQEMAKPGKVKIPDACKAFELECVSLFDMFRAERLVLGPGSRR